MIDKTLLRTLSLWDNPTLFADKETYMSVSIILTALVRSEAPLDLLSQEQKELLGHLVSGSLQATINAFEKAQPGDQGDLIHLLEVLSKFANELDGSVYANRCFS